MNEEQIKQLALDFLKKEKTGVLATATTDGVPHAALLYYVCDDAFTIYFSTLSSTRKFEVLSKNPRAAFAVTTIDVPQTLQMEGIVSEVEEDEKLKLGFSSLIEILESNTLYGWPITKMHEGKVVLMKLTPTWIRWGDFTVSDSVFKEIAALS